MYGLKQYYTLIPDGAVDWHLKERMHHRVVEHAGFILVDVTKQPRNVIRKNAVVGYFNTIKTVRRVVHLLHGTVREADVQRGR